MMLVVTGVTLCIMDKVWQIQGEDLPYQAKNPPNSCQSTYNLFYCITVLYNHDLWHLTHVRESSFNMRRGDEDIETQSLKFWRIARLCLIFGAVDEYTVEPLISGHLVEVSAYGRLHITMQTMGRSRPHQIGEWLVFLDNQDFDFLGILTGLP